MCRSLTTQVSHITARKEASRNEKVTICTAFARVSMVFYTTTPSNPPTRPVALPIFAAAEFPGV